MLIAPVPQSQIWAPPVLGPLCKHFCRGGHSTVVWVGMSDAERRYGGLKDFFFFFAKVRSKELKIFNILRAYKLKFGPNLGCRTKNVFIFWANFSCRSQNLSFLLKSGGSKELNHAATGDLKSGGRGVKSGSCLLDIPVPPGECPPGHLWMVPCCSHSIT